MKIKNPILDPEITVRCGILIDYEYSSLIKSRIVSHGLTFVKGESDEEYMVMEGKMADVKKWFDSDSYWKSHFDDSTLSVKEGETWKELKKEFIYE
jgi:hypothetical protein